MIPADPLHQFWHTPIGVHRFAQADDVNEVLVRVFQTMRATDPGAVDGPKAFTPAETIYCNASSCPNGSN